MALSTRNVEIIRNKSLCSNSSTSSRWNIVFMKNDDKIQRRLRISVSFLKYF